ASGAGRAPLQIAFWSGKYALIITNKCDIDRDYVVCGVLEKIKATGSAGMYTHSSDPRPEQGIWYPVRLFSDK
ncbi:hypothetical protein, partial [uncultured Porphyromonas sp.]|uniref:hypothetical protein n=1 Tax=uncultured Porphyromonas sp. TaxID=159274 RepID=UPI00280626DF